MWRPVAARIATLEEVEGRWSLHDLAVAHLALDYEVEAHRPRRRRKG